MVGSGLPYDDVSRLLLDLIRALVLATLGPLGSGLIYGVIAKLVIFETF